MSVGLYMDENVRSAITEGLRLRGIDVLTAQDDGMNETPDPDILDRAGFLLRLLFTEDRDFLTEVAIRQQNDQSCAGVIFAKQQRVPVSVCVNDLELLCQISEYDDLANSLTFLPLRVP